MEGSKLFYFLSGTSDILEEEETFFPVSPFHLIFCFLSTFHKRTTNSARRCFLAKIDPGKSTFSTPIQNFYRVCKNRLLRLSALLDRSPKKGSKLCRIVNGRAAAPQVVGRSVLPTGGRLGTTTNTGKEKGEKQAILKQPTSKREKLRTKPPPSSSLSSSSPLDVSEIELPRAVFTLFLK